MRMNQLTSLKSHDLTVLSSPPVHSLCPSGEISIHDAPSVWPWNCLQKTKQVGSKNVLCGWNCQEKTKW